MHNQLRVPCIPSVCHPKALNAALIIPIRIMAHVVEIAPEHDLVQRFTCRILT
jgi:hypothetical protein